MMKLFAKLQFIRQMMRFVSNYFANERFYFEL
jgi:hypothetical protein